MLLLSCLNRLKKNEKFEVVFHIASNLEENIFSNLKHETKKTTIFIVYTCLKVIFMQIWDLGITENKNEQFPVSCCKKCLARR